MYGPRTELQPVPASISSDPPCHFSCVFTTLHRPARPGKGVAMRVLVRVEGFR
jgi:hypothetical protein